jgi:hypothetical protein
MVHLYIQEPDYRRQPFRKGWRAAGYPSFGNFFLKSLAIAGNPAESSGGKAAER